MKTSFDIIITVVFLAIAASLLIASFSFVEDVEDQSVINEDFSKNNLQPAIIEQSGVMLNVPAIDNSGKGVTTLLKVQARPGDGKVLADINQILFWVDTQNSIRVARSVAQNFTDVNMSTIDLIYTIETRASAIEGPSAGAALTVATIAAVQNKTIVSDVMITGSIRLDGTIGKVDGILEKAGAAKDIGAKIFLVPKGQGVETEFRPVTKCEEYGVPESKFYQRYCSTEYVSTKTNIGEEIGITVREVGNVEEALEYFFE